MVRITGQASQEKARYSTIGTRPIRHDGLEKVTGQARYGADINLPGMLYARVLRSPHAHARIRALDISRALAAPGVKAVVTSKDLPQPSGKAIEISEEDRLNPRFLSNNVLAAEKALYRGHAIAAVAAVSLHDAANALSLIDVDYEILPPVLDVLKAMEGQSPVLHEKLYTSNSIFLRAGGLKEPEDPNKDSNIASHFCLEIGDLKKGFSEADVVIEREYRTKPVHQGYIEPHSATAIWNQDGKITIWCSSQGHFAMQEQTALILGVPLSEIRVIQMEIGGGFGGKLFVYLEPLAAILSKKAGLPVKVTMSREEVFEGTGPTSGGYVKVKMGATKTGRLTAAEATLIYEAGAYPGSPVNLGAQAIFAPYDIPHCRVEGYDVVVNKPKVAPYRAPGAPVAAFASETVIDEICDELQMDPLSFRLMNAAKEGTRRVTGSKFGRIGFIETLEAAQDHPHNRTRVVGRHQGRGIAAGYCLNGTGASSVTLSLNADGTVNLVEGSPDIGGSRVAVAMQAAEVLEIPVSDVHPLIADTASIGFTSWTGGSGVAFKTGWAAYEAARDLKAQLANRVATIWQTDRDSVNFTGGLFVHKSNTELKLSLKEVAELLNSTGGPITGQAALDPPGIGVTFAVHIADVEVDPETGKTQVVRYTTLQDAGMAVHPGYVEGQMQGGAVQGIGWALNEEYFFDESGKMLNSSFLDYRMPTILDLPNIDTKIVEVPNPGHPFGVRGVGEVSIIPPLAAIANAIYDAIGVRMQSLPMSPGAVLNALWEKESLL